MFDPLPINANPSYEMLDTIEKLSAAYLAGRMIERKFKNSDFGKVDWSESMYSRVLCPVAHLAGDEAMVLDFYEFEYRALIEKAPPILFDSDVSPAV